MDPRLEIGFSYRMIKRLCYIRYEDTVGGVKSVKCVGFYFILFFAGGKEKDKF